MILLDTSVIVDFLRRPTGAMRDVLLRNECFVCGVTLAELLHGVRSPQDAARIREAVGSFSQLSIDDGVWSELGQNLLALRKAGVVVPFQDALRATLAIRHGLALWSTDAHFREIRRVLPALELFDLPA